MTKEQFITSLMYDNYNRKNKDIFTFEEYKKYCAFFNLKESAYKSLQDFKTYCFIITTL